MRSSTWRSSTRICRRQGSTIKLLPTLSASVSPQRSSALPTSPPDLRAQAFGEDWPLIWATRNRIAHGYATIDLGMIKATVRDDLPAFRSSIAQALDQS
jgi:hypothetical protein